MSLNRAQRGRTAHDRADDPCRARSVSPVLNRLLLPASDLGVALQVVVLVVAMVGAWLLSRTHRYWRPLIVGAGMLLFGLMGLRAAH